MPMHFESGVALAKRGTFVYDQNLTILCRSRAELASSAGLSMGFSLRMGFEKKISGREACLKPIERPAEEAKACHKSNKIES